MLVSVLLPSSDLLANLGDTEH